MSLKEAYRTKVLNTKQKYVISLSEDVIKRCEDLIDTGNELPYIITLDKTGLDTVHDLVRLLKSKGVECSAFFMDTTFRSVDVTVTDFI